MFVFCLFSMLGERIHYFYDSVSSAEIQGNPRPAQPGLAHILEVG